MNLSRCAIALLCLMNAPSGATAQSKEPPRNKELEALQAHFERVIDRGTSSSSTRSPPSSNGSGGRSRREGAREDALARYALADGPPPGNGTHREQHPAYTIENLVIETAPKLFLTANLYLPRTGTRPYPGGALSMRPREQEFFARHGAWFAAHGIAALVMDNIEMGEVEFTHHGVYASAWFHWYSRGFSPLAVELLNASAPWTIWRRGRISIASASARPADRAAA